MSSTTRCIRFGASNSVRASARTASGIFANRSAAIRLPRGVALGPRASLPGPPPVVATRFPPPAGRCRACHRTDFDKVGARLGLRQVQLFDGQRFAGQLCRQCRRAIATARGAVNRQSVVIFHDATCLSREPKPAASEPGPRRSPLARRPPSPRAASTPAHPSRRPGA